MRSAFPAAGPRRRVKVAAGALWLAAQAAVSMGAGAAAEEFVSVSAAAFQTPLAPGAMAAGFGRDLAPAVEVAAANGPLPVALARTSVKLKDANGAEWTAALWFVSPTQINYLVPEQAAEGRATVTVERDSVAVAVGAADIERVAPGLFTMNADGKGVPAGWAVVARGGASTRRYLFNAGCAAGACYPVPLGPEAAAGEVSLELYGTGVRGRSSLGAVRAEIGGVEARVEYAGPVAGMAGLDQVNLAAPQGAMGRGEVAVALVVDGRPANTVTVNLSAGEGDGSHWVLLGWAAGSDAAVAGYHVYRASRSAGPFRRISPGPVADTAYVDASVSRGETYYYAITAVDEAGDESAYSNEARADIPR